MASKFGQFLNYYTNQIGAADSAAYQREQTRTLRRSNNEAEMADTISSLINQGIFDARGNLLPGGMEKLHDANIGGQYVDFMNDATVANNFRNKFGDVEKGIILGPSGVAGTDNFVFNVRKRDGKLVPMTERRSESPDDKPLQFSKEDLKNFYEAQARNLIQKGGLVGAAIGSATEQALTNMLSDTNLAPENATDGLGEINEILNKNRSPEEKAAIDSEPSGRDPDFSPSAVEQRQMAKEGQFFKEDQPKTEKGKRNMYSARDFQAPTDLNQLGMSPEEVEKLKNITDKGGNITGAIGDAYRTSKELVTDDQLVALGYLDPKFKTSPLGKTNARRAFLTDFAKLASPQQPVTEGTQGETTEPPSQIETIPALPDNLQDARQWFTDNQAVLEKLPEEDFTRIQNLLKEKNINSAADFQQAVQNGQISQADALKAGAAIAFAVNGPSGSISDKLNVYAALTNTFYTGDPSTTASDMLNTQSLLQSRAATLRTTLRDTFFEPINESAKAVMDSLIDPKTKEFKKKATGEFIKNMKQLNADFLNNFNQLPDADKPAALRTFRRVLGESIALQSRNSKNLMDFFGDIIAPDFQNTQADIFDNIRTRRGADGKIREIVFVNSASPGVETEYSIFPTELKNKFGNVNYKFLIDNAPLLGIEELNKSAKEKKKG